MKALLNKQTEKTDEVLRTIAHMPTKSLSVLMDNDFARGLTDGDFMRVAVFLAQKSYDEGGCPIGAVISITRRDRL
jgi:creatinine deaminase